MLEAGLIKEAEHVWQNRESFRTAAQAIGYKEFFPYFEQTAPLEACTEKLKQASRNYAKRQLTYSAIWTVWSGWMPVHRMQCRLPSAKLANF